MPSGGLIEERGNTDAVKLLVFQCLAQTSVEENLGGGAKSLWQGHAQVGQQAQERDMPLIELPRDGFCLRNACVQDEMEHALLLVAEEGLQRISRRTKVPVHEVH